MNQNTTILYLAIIGICISVAGLVYFVATRPQPTKVQYTFEIPTNETTLNEATHAIVYPSSGSLILDVLGGKSNEYTLPTTITGEANNNTKVTLTVNYYKDVSVTPEGDNVEKVPDLQLTATRKFTFKVIKTTEPTK